MIYAKLDGTSRQSFRLGTGGPSIATGVVVPPNSSGPSGSEMNALDPTNSFLVPVRVGDAVNPTDATNLETVLAMFASLGLSPKMPNDSAADQKSGLYEGSGSSSFAGATIYG